MTPGEIAGCVGAVIAIGAAAEQIRSRLAAVPDVPDRERDRRLEKCEQDIAHERERAQTFREEVLVLIAEMRGRVRRARGERDDE